jgi:pyruvate,water dikinase
MRLEDLFGCPQDIEWCEDMQGSCHLLQCRPLRMAIDHPAGDAVGSESPALPQAILMAGGVTASSGVGIGRVFILENEGRLADVPDGAILVSPTLPPSLAAILERLRAVVAEGGSRASHFASVAREAGLPVLTGLHGAARRLTPGSVVTVDAGRNLVYQGSVSLEGDKKREGTARRTPFMTRLAALMEFVSPLNLRDPASPDFSPQYCGSMHDLVRYAHEKGMAEMFSLVGPGGREMSRAMKLVGDLPLTLHILDLGGGLFPEAAKKKVVGPELVASPLMRACWDGLSDPQVSWPEGLAVLDWALADRHSGGIIGLDSAVYGSYAAVASDYLHLVLRFGYHFAVLDTLGGEDPEANYIAFRFKGGGGSYENRLLRVSLIERVLTWAGFTVKTRGDLLDARFDRRPVAEIVSRLTLLGVLQGRCRLLDMALVDAGHVEEMVAAFKEILRRFIEPRQRQGSGQ